ncbi:MAG: hypothetical protein KGI54_08165 [Pseudomonadota bacterium]|nr:hypothetical protein [Pseudomonadota bacterium]
MNDIESFINKTLKLDLGTMVSTQGLQYLSFGIMGTMIEFLGACFDSKGFFKGGLSRLRFSEAIQKLDAFQGYRGYDVKNSKHDLYKNMRCGMAHIGRPDKGVAFAERNDPINGEDHLKVLPIEDGTKRLILVCEDLYCDLSKAADELLIKMKSGDKLIKKKHTELFLNLKLKTLK